MTSTANVFAKFDIDTTAQIAEIIDALKQKNIEKVNIFTYSIAQSAEEAMQKGICLPI